MADVSTYTRFVALFKSFLWVLVACMIAVVIWISSFGGDNGARMVLSSIPKSEVVESVMQKPHYQGVDGHNQPFTVIADTATQLDKDTVALEGIRADMMLGNGAWVALNSGTGRLNLQSKQLELANGVSIFYEGGYEFRSERAHVDIQAGSASGDAAVEGQGPSGTLNADSFVISDHGSDIRFNGSVTMKLYP